MASVAQTAQPAPRRAGLRTAPTINRSAADDALRYCVTTRELIPRTGQDRSKSKNTPRSAGTVSEVRAVRRFKNAHWQQREYYDFKV